MAEKESKKRRRDSEGKHSHSKKKSSSNSEVDSVTVSKVHVPSQKLAVASFGAIKVPTETEFQVYRNKASGNVLLHGEDETIEYEGETHGDEGQFVVALYDADNKSVELYPQTAFVDVSTAVKAKKYASVQDIKSRDVTRMEQRNKLGESFGTRKARRAIFDLKNNQIDATALADIQSDIVSSVTVSTANLPSQEQVQAKLEEGRPIPPHNAEAENVEDIYPLYGIVPAREWKAIRVDALFATEDATTRQELFPAGSSPYVSKRLAQLTDPALHTERLQLLYYIGLLLSTYLQRRAASHKNDLAELLLHPADVIVRGIVDRFFVGVGTQAGRGKSARLTMDGARESRILCYLLALMLRYDGYMVEIPPTAVVLGLKPSRLSELLRQLGCSITNVGVRDAEDLGLDKADIPSYKIAKLRAPLKLPEMVRRARRG